MRSFFSMLILLSAVAMAAPVPTASGTAPGEQMMGEGFSATVCFTNTGDATGYAPAYEMVVPYGVTFDSAQFAGTSVKTTLVETCSFTQPGQTECNATNPLTGAVVQLDENASFYILEYPLGSMPTDMPQQCMDLSFTLASSPTVEIGVPLDLELTPFFSLGTDGEDNPQTDPPIYGTPELLPVIPVVFKITKTFNARENETVSGPHFAKSVTFALDVAAGETAENVLVTDDLPGELQYVALTDNGGCSVNSEPSTTVPGGTLSLDCGDITGVAGTDRTITFSFYVPENDADGNPVLDPQTGAFNTVLNVVDSAHDYNGTVYHEDANDTIVVKPAAIFKDMAIYEDNGVPGISPTDILEYNITVRLSDYFSIENMLFRDTLDNTQQDYHLQYGAYYIVHSASGDVTGDFNVSTSLLLSNDVNTGEEFLDFNLSKALLENGEDANLTGGDGITVTIRFLARILEEHRGDDVDYLAVKAGDHITNKASSSTDIVGGDTAPSDGTSTDSQIAKGEGGKSVYAINGDTNITPPYKVRPGDTVTFRLLVEFPIASFKDANITDYLPSPIFAAAEMNETDTPQYYRDATPPDAGRWSSGTLSDINLTGIQTHFLVNASQNSIVWTTNPKTVDANVTRSGTIELFFTVTATGRPMADQLKLANLGTVSYENSKDDTIFGSDIVNVIAQEPSIVASQLKTIAGTTNPRSSFVIPPPADYNSSLKDVDANDTVTYRILIQNDGNSTAYQVSIRDRFGQGGIAGQGLANCTVKTTENNTSGSVISGDLFTDDLNVSKIDPKMGVRIVYECTVDPLHAPGDDINNTAELLHYASVPDGPNFVTKPMRSGTLLMLDTNATIVKTVAATSIPETDGTSLNQGEIAYFDINVTLTEGTYTNFAVTDDTCVNRTLQATSANVAVSGTTVTVAGTEGSVDGNLSYRCEYQAVAGGTNTATVTSDQTTAKSDSASWTVVDPVVVTSKTMNPADADAGDTVTVTMDWTNDTAHPAFECRIVDPLDTAVFDTSTFLMTQTPSDYDCDLNTTNDTVVCTYTGDLTKPCSDGPAKFTLKVRDDVNTSGTLTNEIGFYGVTLPEGHQGEDNSTINGDVESNATADLNLLAPKIPVKTFSATSEDFTDPGDQHLGSTPDVAVGEVIDVNISFDFYEGTTLDVVLSDYFNDFPADNAFVYVPGTMRISRSSTQLEVENSTVNSALASVSPGTYAAVSDSEVSAGATRIDLPLGNVYNRSTLPTTRTETLKIAFRVKVQNETAVQAGTVPGDRGRVEFSDGQSGASRQTQSDRLEVRIVEPSPAIVKDVNQTTVQAGTSLHYTVEICNDENNDSNNPAAATSGFDWNVTDRLPPEMEIVGTPLVDVGSTGANVNLSASTREINATIDRLDRGECVTVEYNTTVLPTVHFGQILTNTAQYQTTSLPGFYGSAGLLSGLADQAPGEQNGERTGSAAGVNDLYGETTQSVVASELIISKVHVDEKPFYAIGEKAHFRIAVGLPKGEANDTKIEDTLPAGLEFNASDVSILYGPNLTLEHRPPLISQTGQIVTFDFGDLNASSLSSIRIDYNVTVTNSFGNQDGTVLVNDANASYADPNNAGARLYRRPSSPAGPVNVGEPNLFIQKFITAGAVKAQAGSTVDWQVEISNTGHVTAYAVDWNDTLPAHLAEISNAALTLSGSAVLTGTATALNSSHLLENNQTLSLPKFDLPVGSKVTVTFESIVQNAAVAGEDQTNETNATYRSLLEGIPGARDGSECGDDDVDTHLNNYCESAQANLVIDANLAVDKHLLTATDHFTIGMPVVYKMRISLIQGRTTNVVLNDLLPDGLEYISHTHQAGASAMRYDFASANVNSGSGQQVTIDFGDVNNSADGNLSNDYIDVELKARVMNRLVNQNGVKPLNGDTQTSPVTVTSDANNSAVSIPVEITIIEPDLNVTKTVTPVSQSVGDIVTYRIDVRHASTSTSDAYDINLTDTLPPEMTYIAGSATGATVTQNGQILTFGFAHIPQGTGRTVTYRAQLASSAAIGVDVNNSLDAVFSSLHDENSTGGTPSGPRNGIDGIGPDATTLNNYARHAEAAVTPNNYELNITKKVTWIDDRNNDGLVSIGDYLEYNLSINNPYTYSVGDVNFTDPLPIETTYLLNTLSLSDMANGNSVDDSDVTEMKAWITELVAGETNYISFRVEINADVPAGTTITNVGYVDSNRTVPTPSNEANITTDARGFPGTPSKNIFDSSEPTTTLPNVAVGEVIDVNISFPFTGGTTKSVVLRDKFNADEFEYVANSMHLQRSSTGIRVSQSDLNASFGGGSLDIAVDDSNLTIDASGLALNVEDVANTDYNGLVPTEQLTMVFKLRVKNTASVNRDGTLNDRGEVEYALYHPDTNSSSTETIQTSAVGVTVNEPLPQVSKTNDKPAAAAGDTVTFTVKLCNDEAGTATDVASAFDWNATDVLPATLQPTGTPSVDGAPGTASFSGQTLSVSIPQIDQGQCATVTYSAVIQGTAQVDENITNTVRFETTSLPGTDSGERTGSGGINDLHGFAQSQITIGAPSIAKDVSALQTYYPVGDAVEYNITVALPGSAQTVTVTDRLPDGLIYNTGSVRLVTAPGMTVGNNPPNVTQIANVIMFELGDVNITSAASLYLEFNATVDNVIGNQDGTQLVNSAELTYKDPATGSDVTLPIVESAAITVGEPSVTMQKQVTSGAAGAQAGDTVGFSVVMDNSAGHTTAYAVQWSDIMPEHLAQIGNIAVSVSDGTAYLSGTTTPIGSADAGVTTTYAPDDTIALPPFDLSAGAKLKVTFDTVVQPDVKANEQITNETNSIWQSFLGSIFRDGSDGIGGALNDYAADANATLNINANIAITKTLLGAASYTIGDEVTYKISVSSIAGVTEDVNVTDYLPAGLEYVRHTHQPSAPTMRYDTVSADANEGNATRVVISLGDINNTGSASDTVDIELTARVLNVMGNQDGIVPSNGDVAAGSPVSVRYSIQRPSVPRAASRALVVTEANVTTPAPLTIVEPELQLTKTVNPPSQAVGKAVTYHIELRHTPQSTATAYDVNFTDTLPANLSYIPGSAAGAVVTQNGQQLTFSVPVLQLTDVVNVTYQARIAAAADTNTTLLNQAEAVYGSLPDANGTRYGARNGSDRNATGALNDYFTYSNAPVRPNRDDFVVAIKEVYVIDDNNSDNMVNAGDALRYEINITNTGSYMVGDVHFEDIVPVETTYLIGTLRLSDYAGGANTVDESNTSMLIADIEQMVAGDMISVWFDVRINDDVPGGVTILNQAVVDSNRTIPYKSSWPGDPTPHTPTPITTVNVPLFDTDARMVLMAMMLLAGAAMLYRRRREWK